MPRAIFDWNPIQVAERMTATDDFAWNAFAYTYNKLRPRRLCPGAPALREPDFAGVKLVRDCAACWRNRHRQISNYCRSVETALDYACFVAHEDGRKKTIYVNTGGQPSQRGRVG